MYRVVIVTVLLAVGASARADVVSNVDPDDKPVPCTKPMPFADVCGCLAKAGYGKTCAPIGPEEVKGARLIRVTSEDGGNSMSVIFLAANTSTGWRVILGVDDELNNGHDTTTLHPSAQTELHVGAARVYRLDYRVKAQDCPRGDDPCNNSDDSFALLCPLEGAPNAPACTAKTMLRCDHWDGDDDKKKPHRKTARADLSISPKGALTRTVTTKGPSCLDKAEPRSLF